MGVWMIYQHVQGLLSLLSDLGFKTHHLHCCQAPGRGSEEPLLSCYDIIFTDHC